MSRREWRSIYYTVIGSLIAVAIAGVGGIVFAAVTSHASAAELVRVERESRARDIGVQAELRAHEKAAEREWRTQAQFRGSVSTALKIEAPKEDSTP